MPRFAIIAETLAVSTSRDRRRGYQEALAAAGIAFEPQLLIETTVDLPGGYRGMQTLLGLERCPTAVFATNNLTAVGAVKAIREHGLAVPHDIALVAFDDIEHVAILSPFLTVMPQAPETFGAIAAQLLVERINGRASEKRHVVILPSDIIVRESCGAHQRTPLTIINSESAIAWSS